MLIFMLEFGLYWLFRVSCTALQSWNRLDLNASSSSQRQSSSCPQVPCVHCFQLQLLPQHWGCSFTQMQVKQDSHTSQEKFLQVVGFPHVRCCCIKHGRNEVLLCNSCITAYLERGFIMKPKLYAVFLKVEKYLHQLIKNHIIFSPVT